MNTLASSAVIASDHPIVAACITIAGAIFVAYLSHRFSKKRESIARHAAACSDFRAAIQAAVIEIPPANQHWSNEVLTTLPKTTIAIGLAVAVFSHHLRGKNRICFEGEWDAMKKHCDEKIPHALSSAEVLYGGGTAIKQEAKETFHAHVKALLAYAPQTQPYIRAGLAQKRASTSILR